jgi:hypothetical protein
VQQKAEKEARRALKSLAKPSEQPHPLDGKTMDKITQSKYDKILKDARDPKDGYKDVYKERRKPGT